MRGDDLIKFYERQYGPFTHMAPGDKAIWVRYLMHGGNLFAPFAYDIRVGNGTQMPPGSTNRQLRTAYALSTKRIDVLCAVSGTMRIIEVKQRAGAGAVGQLITYRDLYLLDTANKYPVEMWLITDELQPDMSHVLTGNNIHCVEVGL